MRNPNDRDTRHSASPGPFNYRYPSTPLLTVITISRMFGSGSQAIAREVGEAFGVPVVDQALPELVATRLGIAAATAEELSQAPKPLVERILGGFAMSAPELGAPDDIDAEVAGGVEQAIREAAAQPCVILGRAAGLVLAGRPGVCKVFLHAPLPWRAARIRDILGCSLRAAEAEAHRVDRARAAYIRDRYGADWLDLTRYDLTLDVSAAGIEASSAAIVTFAREFGA